MMSLEKKVEARALPHTKESLSFILKAPSTFKHNITRLDLHFRNMTLASVRRFLGNKPGERETT